MTSKQSKTVRFEQPINYIPHPSSENVSMSSMPMQQYPNYTMQQQMPFMMFPPTQLDHLPQVGQTAISGLNVEFEHPPQPNPVKTPTIMPYTSTSVPIQQKTLPAAPIKSSSADAVKSTLPSPTSQSVMIKTPQISDVPQPTLMQAVPAIIPVNTDDNKLLMQPKITNNTPALSRKFLDKFGDISMSEHHKYVRDDSKIPLTRRAIDMIMPEYTTPDAIGMTKDIMDNLDVKKCVAMHTADIESTNSSVTLIGKFVRNEILNAIADDIFISSKSDATNITIRTDNTLLLTVQHREDDTHAFVLYENEENFIEINRDKAVMIPIGTTRFQFC